MGNFRKLRRYVPASKLANMAANPQKFRQSFAISNNKAVNRSNKKAIKYGNEVHINIAQPQYKSRRFIVTMVVIIGIIGSILLSIKNF